ASRTFVRKVGRDPSYLLRIITTDEIWVHYFESESKRASMVWKHADSPPPKKVEAVMLMGKDNALSHTPRNTQLDIDVLGFQQASIHHIPPILRHCISHIFQNRDWFMNVYENWVRRHHKCIAHKVEYFEKA
ncbi:hypothetical protein MAR_007830, partial [Mya arenaria]